MLEKKSDSQPMLFALPEPEKIIGENEETVTTLLAELDNAGLLNASYKAKGKILVGIAKAVDAGLGEAKISIATAQLLRQLTEMIDSFPQPARENSPDAYDTLAHVIRYMTEAAIKTPEALTDYEPQY